MNVLSLKWLFQRADQSPDMFKKNLAYKSYETLQKEEATFWNIRLIMTTSQHIYISKIVRLWDHFWKQKRIMFCPIFPTPSSGLSYCFIFVKTMTLFIKRPSFFDATLILMMSNIYSKFFFFSKLIIMTMKYINHLCLRQKYFLIIG